MIWFALKCKMWHNFMALVLEYCTVIVISLFIKVYNIYYKMKPIKSYPIE